MKRLLTLLALACATAVSHAATLNPVQLLNPAGSTAGQAIVSNGPSTAPAWGSVSAAALAAQAANTVVANVAASSASPTAVALPSCSTANSALYYTSGTGFGCRTNTALITGSVFTGNLSFNYVGATNTRGLIWTNNAVNRWSLTNDGTAESGSNTGSNLALNSFNDAGTFINSPLVVNRASGAVAFTGLITPTSGVGIKGTATNDSVQAGSIGEVISQQVNGTSLTTGTAVNLTSVSLSAGSWMVMAYGRFNPAGTTTVQNISTSVSTTSATPGGLGRQAQIVGTLGTGGAQYLASPVTYLSLASTTTVYCVGVAGFSVSTMTGDCLLYAVRGPR